MSPGMRALNRLCKMTVDPDRPAALLRVEVNGLAALLIEKGVFTAEEWDRQLVIETRHLEGALEKQFPGATARDDGMHLDAELVTPWMSKFPQ